MDSKEYKRIINEAYVLDFDTLEATRKELERLGQNEILIKILRILAINKIEKPTLHSQKENKRTDFYKVDLNQEEINAIVTMFGDLEVSALGADYETTNEASFYSNMLDKWSNLLIY
jgi:hypothetical protein